MNNNFEMNDTEETEEESIIDVIKIKFGSIEDYRFPCNVDCLFPTVSFNIAFKIPITKEIVSKTLNIIDNTISILNIELSKNNLDNLVYVLENVEEIYMNADDDSIAIYMNMGDTDADISLFSILKNLSDSDLPITHIYIE